MMDAQQDRGQCASFGFRPDTPSFANCMMNLSNQRQLNATIQDIAAVQGQQAEEDRFNRRQDRIKDLAMERSGDTRFPVCSATSDDSGLDVMAGGWYGRNCRMN